MNKIENIINQYRWKSVDKEYLDSHNIVFCEGSNLHPSFRLYKYYWWIFAKNSEFSSAGEVFYNQKYKLTTKQAIIKMEFLQFQNIPFAYVNRKVQRLGCKIWNYEKITMNNPYIEFAPSYDVDTDEPWNYHK